MKFNGDLIINMFGLRLVKNFYEIYLKICVYDSCLEY